MIQAIIESGRAEFALDAVKEVIGSVDDKTKKEYKSYAKKLPSLVLTNGLAATVAFACEKGGAWDLLVKNISCWLVKKKFFADKDGLKEYLCSLYSDDYRIVTNEVLSLFEWVRRFASGMIEGEATND